MGTLILVAEDDVKQAEVVRRYLEHEGHEVLVVHDGRSALETARQRRPDLLVLDVMMPRVDGFDVCRVLRRESDVPVIVLTARTGEDDLLLALDLGADDYVTKPYSPRELVARVRTLLRRAPREPAAGTGDAVLRVGPLALDPGRREATVGEREVRFTAGEFDILAAMAARPGRVFTRSQLLEVTRGSDRWITERTIDVHVSNVRRKIEQDPRRPELLRTVFGVGYKLTPPAGERRGA